MNLDSVVREAPLVQADAAENLGHLEIAREMPIALRAKLCTKPRRM